MNGKRKRIESPRVAIACVVASLAFLGVAPAALSTPSSSAKKVVPARFLIKVQARIRVDTNPGQPPIGNSIAPRLVTFSPALINVGTVIIEVSNSDDNAHQLEINGVMSRRMGGGGKAVMRVTFKKPGTYPVALTAETPVIVNGALRVVK